MVREAKRLPSEERPSVLSLSKSLWHFALGTLWLWLGWRTNALASLDRALVADFPASQSAPGRGARGLEELHLRARLRRDPGSRGDPEGLAPRVEDDPLQVMCRKELPRRLEIELDL